MKTPDVTARLLIAASLATLAGMIACSDDFSATGGTFPADVAQDSVAIQLDPPLAPVQEVTVPIDYEEPYEDRDVLYWGSGPEDPRSLATPLIRFDLSPYAGYADTLVVTPDNWESLEIVLQEYTVDATIDLAITRSVEVFALGDTLQSTDTEAALASLLGASLRSYPDGAGMTAGAPTTLPLVETVNPADPVVQLVDGWLQTGQHEGVAIVETAWVLADTTQIEDSVVRIAAQGSENRAATAAAETDPIVPILKIELVDPEGAVMSFEPLMDLTHIETPIAAESRLLLSASVVNRTWLEFELPGPEVPGNATINEATLVLSLDSDRDLAVGSTRVVSYWGTLTDAMDLERGSATAIFGGAETILAGFDTELRIDVTETVQQAVNGLFEGQEGLGFLLSLDDELGDLTLFHFYGSDAPADSLMPHIDLTFTPPANFVE